MVKEVLKTIAIFVISCILVSFYVNKRVEIDVLQKEITSLQEDIKIERQHIFASNSIIDDMREHIDFLEKQVADSNEKIREYEDNIYDVTVTMYHPVPEQTDSTPNITADGTRFSINKASQYRYVAVARNMLKRWGGFLDYGDYIWVDAGSKSGIYQVRDTMNPRYVNYIDILETPGTTPYKYEKGKIRLISYDD